MVQYHLNRINAQVARGGIFGVTNVDGINVTIVILVRHVAIREEAIGKQRQQNELGEGQELVAREGEARAPRERSASNMLGGGCGACT